MTATATNPIKNGIALMPVMTIEEAVQRYKVVKEFVGAVMVKDRDYGQIPGTEKKKADGKPGAPNNTLYKPGAERLCTLFGLVEDYEDVGSIVDTEKGFFHFAYKCVLLRNAAREFVDGKLVILGDVVGTGLGSCNSREKKYRRGGKQCPECGAVAIKRSKFSPKDAPEEKPGWYCHAAVGGCGEVFDFDDPEILELKQTDNPGESCDIVNTLMKMAMKRAKIGAVLAATNASDFFNHADGEPAQEEAEDAPPVIDWLAVAMKAKNADDLNAIIQHWGDVPNDAKNDVKAATQFMGARLGFVYDSAAKKWGVAPTTEAKPTTNGTTAPKQDAPPPSTPSLEGEFTALCNRIEMLAVQKGKVVRTLLNNRKLHQLSLEEAGDMATALEKLPDHQGPTS